MNPIRVLHVVTIMNRAGIETLLMNLYRRIDKNKIQFDFLVHTEDKGHYDDEIIDLGGKIFHINKLVPFKTNKYQKELRSFFSAHKEYQIVHSHLNTFSKHVMKAAKDVNIPVKIAHSHISFPGYSLKSLYKAISRLNINRYVDYKFACSEDAARWVFGSKDNVKIFPNAIDSNQFKFDLNVRQRVREELGADLDTLIIGNVGRLAEQKNHKFLLDVFSYINKKNPNSILTLLGEGELEDFIKNKSKELNVSENVKLLGVRDNVNDYLQAMDVFLFPSKFEGLGIVAIEAQASGLRTIASTKVPKETNVTSLIEYLSLNDPINVWGDKVLNTTVINDRRDMINDIIKAGYDIQENVNWLQYFYRNVD